MNYLLYIIFGLIPSAVWLFFYLRKDSHPEPNLMVLKIFFYGAIAAIIAGLAEVGIFSITDLVSESNKLLFIIFNIFIGVALTEELLKYLVVRLKVLRDTNFDEPLDAMLYMIIAALGFAALENILILWFKHASLSANLTTTSNILVWGSTFTALRFLGATFLHALVSGAVGYFIGLKIQNKNRFPYVLIGLIIAMVLHGLYNYSIMFITGTAKIIIPVIIIGGLAVLVSIGFKKLKRLKSVCL